MKAVGAVVARCPRRRPESSPWRTWLRPERVAILSLALLIAAGDPVGAAKGRSERSVASVESRTAGEPVMAIIFAAQPADHCLRCRRLDPAGAGLERSEGTRNAGRYLQRDPETSRALL
jgi:hypothetical protein